jgi:hypothetical protein
VTPRRARRGLRARVAGAAGIASLLTASLASAEPPWVDRHITLPEHDWAFDFGLGIAHDYDRPHDITGPGLNIEGAVSPVDRLEIGLRTGIRIGDDGRATRADQYGRLFDRQTFDTGTDIAANPEFRIRGALVRTRVVELALEGRASLPFEPATRFGAMFGMPVLFHFGDRVRMDIGVYVPLIFDTPIYPVVSAPIDLWIQATPRLWLGPMSGVVFHSANNQVDVPLGFGLGYQFTRTFDLKTQVLFPAINETHGAESFGLGAGIQVRIE